VAVRQYGTNASIVSASDLKTGKDTLDEMCSSLPVGIFPAQSDRGAWLIVVIVHNFFDKVDDAAPELALFNPHERLYERQPVTRGEKLGDIGW
jgi:hypothetical protein